jgi:choline dehydrogenase
VSSAHLTWSANRVYALAGLRMVDASIMPRVITGNRNAPVLMTAETISDDIRGRDALAPSTVEVCRRPG